MRVSSRWFAACLVLLAACNPQAPKPTPAPSKTPGPSHTPIALHITGSGTSAKPVRMFQQIHNRIQYELLASSFESRGAQGKTRAVFQNARVSFHDRNGSTMTAKAPQAVWDEAADTITLVNGVDAQTASGMTLRCDRLVYDRKTEMLHGTGNVAISDPKGFHGTGSSFDSDISLTHVQMR